MKVTLDFICMRLSRETGMPEVLLQRRKKGREAGRLALVGGWVWDTPPEQPQPDQVVQIDNTLDDAIQRILLMKVGLLPNHIEQCEVSGGVYRDPELGFSVTIPYLCLFNKEETPSFYDDEDTGWFDVFSIIDGTMALPFDHNKLVSTAYQMFLNKIAYSSIILNLIPERFTVTDLMAAFATLGLNVSKQTLFCRFIKSGLVYDTGDRVQNKLGGRPAPICRPRSDEVVYFDISIGKKETK